MVGRRRELDGRRVTICAKVSEPVADAIDGARGNVSRSAWVEAAIRARLATSLPQLRIDPEALRAAFAKAIDAASSVLRASLDDSEHHRG